MKHDRKPSSKTRQAADPRARLPSVDRVLQAAPDLIATWGRSRVLALARRRLDRMRHGVANGPASIVAIVEGLRIDLELASDATLRPVFNLTGTILHTNLGRAALPEEAVTALVRSAGACNLEFDLEHGERGDRDDHCEVVLCELTGAEAATITNNNAAAVLLILNALALGQEVPVSRGELIEIGGAFRMPDIMTRAGCRLVEVGTTNRTHRRDYEAAIGSNTAMLMKVHPSNYEIRGFTREVGIRELAALAHEHGLPCVMDQGSGTLVDLRDCGLPHEPSAREVLEAGADLVSFSGDKLLGGPQCGIIAGRRLLIDRIRKNPLKRALRVDKLRIAALAAVLNLYRHPEKLAERLPTLRCLKRDEAEIGALGESLLPSVRAALGAEFEVSVDGCFSQVGSGALPMDLLPSHGLLITCPKAGGRSGRKIAALAASLRMLERPVIGRLHDAGLLLDLRCLDEPETFLQQLPALSGSECRSARDAFEAD